MTKGPPYAVFSFAVRAAHTAMAARISITAAERGQYLAAVSIVSGAIQAITALEILFGEHDEKTRLRSSLGVGELLANRYAYSVATGPARKAAAKEFKTVYEARSRVVHSGSDNVEPDVLHAARRMCMRAITHELTVLSEA